MLNKSLVFGIIFTLFAFAAKLSAQNEMIVWKPTIGTESKGTLTLTGHTKSIRTAAFSPDDNKIVTSSDDGTVRIWDARTGTNINTFTWTGSWILSATYSADGKRLLISNWGAKTANIIDAATGANIISFYGHTDGVWWAVYSNNERKIATTSWDKSAKIWDASTGRELLTLKGHTDSVDGVVFSPDDSKIATSSWDKSAKIWDANTGVELITLRHTTTVNSVAFSPDGTKLLTSGSDGLVRVWDIKSGTEVMALRGHGSQVVYAEFNHDGTKIISAAKDNTAKIWDAKTGTELNTLSGHTDHVWNSTFSKSGTRAVTVGVDKTVKVWTLISSKPFEAIVKKLEYKLSEYAKTKLAKGEFESKAEYAERMKKLQSSMSGVRAELLQVCLQEEMGSPKLTWSRYDADERKVYLKLSATNAEYAKQISFGATPDEAREIKDGSTNLEPYVYFALAGQALSLEEVKIFYRGRAYSAKADDSAKTESSVMYAINSELLKPINLQDATKPIKSSTSEGDDLAPLIASAKAAPVNPKKWLFAVAVENYDETDKVIYAKKSAEEFITVAQKKFGISTRNTYAFVDEKATTTALTDRLNRFLANIKEGDTIYFYYSGHGIPSPEDGEAYFLPKDKMVDYVIKEKELMATRIYEKLGKSKAANVIVFVDACFSGKTDNVSTLKGVAAGVLKSKKLEFDKNKMVVLSAGSAKQFSNSYDDKGHRLFSYFLMKNILENEHLDIDLLYKKTAAQVKEVSWTKGDTYLQEPTLEGNSAIKLK